MKIRNCNKYVVSNHDTDVINFYFRNKNIFLYEYLSPRI